MWQIVGDGLGGLSKPFLIPCHIICRSVVQPCGNIQRTNVTRQDLTDDLKNMLPYDFLMLSVAGNVHRA